MRVGIGYDSHRFVNGRNLIIGGVDIPHEKGLLGHSDADVLLHAMCDALIGALGEGDIGRHFPDTAPAYKDISSLSLLRKVKKMVDERGYRIINIDSTVILEMPRLREYMDTMEQNVTIVLDMEPGTVNIKATTNEGMGFTGRGEGVAAFAVALIRREDEP